LNRGQTGSRWWYLLLLVPIVGLLAVAGLLTVAFRALGGRDTGDETRPADYDELVETGRAAPVADAPTG
jgi:hypothetical protein